MLPPPTKLPFYSFDSFQLSPWGSPCSDVYRGRLVAPALELHIASSLLCWACSARRWDVCTLPPVAVCSSLLLSNILSCEDVTMCLFIYPLMDASVFSIFYFILFLLLWIELLWIFLICFYGEKYVLISLVGRNTWEWNWWLIVYVGRCVILKRKKTCQTVFQNWASHFMLPPMNDAWVIVLGPHQHLGLPVISLTMMILCVWFAPSRWTQWFWTMLPTCSLQSPFGTSLFTALAFL